MDPERWRQIERLYYSALEQETAERHGFLIQACQGDTGLVREVETLLEQSGATEALIDKPGWAVVHDLASTQTALNAHQMLGPYEIVELLGAGGMGEVYSAVDTRLGRRVAIKISQERFSGRFKREARAISALNHPHICSLYDVGPDYLVMEYVEGEPLRGPMPLAQALALADQILDALDAAHRKGIIHRDLKPGNILLGGNGVKVVDFGLARIEHTAASGAGPQSSTETMPLTAKGFMLGTLPYMSPEQIEGHDADARTDIFAFGIVLYELIAGRRPFAANSQASLIASILKEQPKPLNELEPLVPAGVAEVVRICLEKDTEQRWQSAREVRHALKCIPIETSAVPTNVRSVRVWQGLAALMALIAVGMAGWMFRAKTPGPVSRFEASLPENITPGDDVSVSPDGRKLVFNAAGGGGLWVRDVDALEWRHLPGTEGASSPFWSPDSRYLGFAAGERIRKLDTTGGPPETLCTVPGNVLSSGAWNRDGVILFGSWGGGAGGPLWKISQAGGAATAITQTDASKGELYDTWPTFLPDGKHFLCFRSGKPEVQGIYAGSLDLKPADQPGNRILASSLPACYANGYLFFMRAATLMAQPFDAGRLQLKGVPVSVGENILFTWYATGVFSVSPSGSLVYRTGSGAGKFQITWVDRQGKALSTLGPPGPDAGVTLSPDGRSAVVKDSPYDVPGDLWTLDFATERRTRLTFRNDVYSPGVWSPDGARIAYAAGDLGDKVYDKASSGAGEERELLNEPGVRHYVTDWSRDGRFLLYHTENAPKTGYDVWVLPLQGNRKPVLLLGDTFNEWAAVFSPDVRWIAYASTETRPGTAEVFVRPFRVSEASGMPVLGEGKWQVSKDGGNWPRWRSDKEIIFNGPLPGTSVFAAPVKASGAAFESGALQRLFGHPYAAYSGADITSDGQRFLLSVPQIETTPRNSITVLLNWPALLESEVH